MSSTAIELLTHLSFIAAIIPGYKINVKTNTVTGSDSRTGSVFRFISGESRKETIKYINNIITRVIETTPKEDPNTQASLIDSLRKAVDGINNLKSTYDNDIYYVAELSSEIIRIEHFIKWMCSANDH
jgi:hypothetical protein